MRNFAAETSGAVSPSRQESAADAAHGQPGDDGLPHKGSIVAGVYRLDALLGRGPSGAVYNAWHMEQQRAYAVKVLHPELSALTAALVRLRHDNQAIGRLRHQHLLLGCAEVLLPDEGWPLLVRPLWPGEPLRQRLLSGPMTLGEVCRLFVVLCGAIEVAHRHGVIHGDLKPENLLLGHAMTAEGLSEETVQVLDFGLYHLRHGDGGIGSHPLLGTVSYLAPEQIRGDEGAIDGRADIFSLGALLYECLTGRVMFDGAHASVVVAKICHGETPLPSAVHAGPGAGLPRAVDVVVEMACHKEPDERFATPRALWAALYEAVAQVPGVREALQEEAGPSAASSTVSLLPWASQQSGISGISAAAPPAGTTPAGTPPVIDGSASAGTPLARPRKQVHKRRRGGLNGRRAIALYKELEQAKTGHFERSQEMRREAAEAAAEILDSGAAREARAEERRQRRLEQTGGEGGLFAEGEGAELEPGLEVEWEGEEGAGLGADEAGLPIDLEGVEWGRAGGEAGPGQGEIKIDRASGEHAHVHGHGPGDVQGRDQAPQPAGPEEAGLSLLLGRARQVLGPLPPVLGLVGHEPVHIAATRGRVEDAPTELLRFPAEGGLPGPVDELPRMPWRRWLPAFGVVLGVALLLALCYTLAWP